MRNGWLALIIVSLIVLIAALFHHPARARDDGRYANSTLKPWFDGLKSKKWPCCSDADGFALSDVDWESKDGKYRVRIESRWWDVPEDAVLTQPNLAGKTMVWPLMYRDAGVLRNVDIRCFIPGSMT